MKTLKVEAGNFSRPPFGGLKIFGAPPPQYLHHPPLLVILNELSLIRPR